MTWLGIGKRTDAGYDGVRITPEVQTETVCERFQGQHVVSELLAEGELQAFDAVELAIVER